ncbi:MAG: DUF4157 domain-containing protein [Myxococcales bacterium]|nr:DUF4157 domain-containing protein [Myxococcales bacterium]
MASTPKVLRKVIRTTATHDDTEREADEAAEAAAKEPESKESPEPAPPSAEDTPRPARSATKRSPAAEHLMSDLDAGVPLPDDVRRLMEQRFGVDFGDVRIHVGFSAARAAEAVNAKAFTVGAEIVFGEGQWAPNSISGRRLLAHELAHVIQQRRDVGIEASPDESEQDAESAAHGTQTDAPHIATRAEPGSIQREEKHTAGVPLHRMPQGSANAARPLQVRSADGGLELIPAGHPLQYTENIRGVSYTIHYKTKSGQRSSTSNVPRAWLSNLQPATHYELPGVISVGDKTLPTHVVRGEAHAYLVDRDKEAPRSPTELDPLRALQILRSPEFRTWKKEQIAAAVRAANPPPTVEEVRGQIGARFHPSQLLGVSLQEEKKRFRVLLRIDDENVVRYFDLRGNEITGRAFSAYADPEAVEDAYTSGLNLQEERLGAALATNLRKGDFELVENVLEHLDAQDYDNVASSLLTNMMANPLDLVDMLSTKEGQKLADKMYHEITWGFGDMEFHNRYVEIRKLSLEPTALDKAKKDQANGDLLVFGVRNGGLRATNLDVQLWSTGAVWARTGVDFHPDDGKRAADVIGGVAMDPNQIVGVRLYHEGSSKLYFVPAVALVGLGNENDFGRAVTTIEVSAIAVAGVTGAAATPMGMVGIGADSLSLATSTFRGEIIAEFGERGRDFITAVNLATSLLAATSAATLLKQGPSVLAKLRRGVRYMANLEISAGISQRAWTVALLMARRGSKIAARLAKKLADSADEAGDVTYLDGSIVGMVGGPPIPMRVRKAPTVPDVPTPAARPRRASMPDIPSSGPPKRAVSALDDAADARRGSGDVDMHKPLTDRSGRTTTLREIAESVPTREPATIARQVESSLGDAHVARLTDAQGRPLGVDVVTQPHRRASDVRRAAGLTGSQAESAHGAMSAFLRDLPGYSREDALTHLLDPQTHTQFDRGVMAWARQLRARGVTQVSLREVLRAHRSAIQRTNRLASRQRDTIEWMIEAEIHTAASRLEHGLDTMVAVPHVDAWRFAHLSEAHALTRARGFANFSKVEPLLGIRPPRYPRGGTFPPNHPLHGYRYAKNPLGKPRYRIVRVSGNKATHARLTIRLVNGKPRLEVSRAR